MGVSGGISKAVHSDTGDRNKTTERSRQLRLMAANLLTMARQLEDESVAATQPFILRDTGAPHREMIDKGALQERASLAYANRRHRRRFFPAELFGEPAWDMLLDLFQARLEGKMITVTSACIAADVPVTTALRWIGVLEAQGLVERSRNVNDQRSTWVRLTDSAATAMIQYTEGCITRERRVGRLAEEHLFTRLDNEAA